jgi:kumamolisin
METLGRAPGDEPVTVSVYLKDRSADSMTPHTADGPPPRRSREAFRKAREADHEGDVEAMRKFAADHGLELAYSDPARKLVQLKGNISAIEQAFGTELHDYKSDGRVCRTREGALHVPEDVADRIDAVLGLDTRPFATPKIVPHTGNPPPGFFPNAVAALYGFGGLDASGQCIALIELGGGYSDTDNAQAFGAMGLPVPEVVSVSVDGAGNAPGDPSGAHGEVALDIQVAGGTAPGAKIAVYFAPNTSQGFVDAVTSAIHDEENAPSAISISWGAPESGWSGQALTAMNAALKDAATLGVTVTAASGDAGATDGEDDGKAHVDYPASNPYVLGCGGTRITASDTISSEVVWNSNGGGTGGGVSALFPLPAYQKTAKVPAPTASDGGRGVPDVAGNADPDSGYRIVIDGQSGIIGGTSAVAPLWAGIVAACNAARGTSLGFFHETLYENSTGLNDISSGDNRIGTIGFAAAPGWDACTGLGSPSERLRQILSAAKRT